MSEQKESRERLLNIFDIPARDAWRSEVDRLLKGASYERRMLNAIEDGLVVEPLYQRSDVSEIPWMDALPGSPPFVRGRRAHFDAPDAWDVAQEIRAPDLRSARLAAMEAIDGGVTTLILTLDAASRSGLDPDKAAAEEVGCGGISLATFSELQQLLTGVDLSKTSIVLRAGVFGLPYLAMILAVASNQQFPEEELSGAIAMDPLGEWVRYGTLPCGLNWAYQTMAEATLWAKKAGPNLGTAWIHGEIYHDGGGSAVQELALALATGVTYLRELESRGVSPAHAARHMRFSFALGNRFFLEIAKIRAARILWSRVLEVVDVPQSQRGMWIHGSTSRFTKTVFDAHVNMLRCTTEALSGAVGGVDSLEVTPFDETFRSSDSFSRRIARNTQTIIRDESHLGKVMDVAGGSFFVEHLTNELVHRAWTLFQEVERLGGMRPALEGGFPQREVARVLPEKRRAVSLGRHVRVGVTAYPNTAETLPDVDRPDLDEFCRSRAAVFQEQRSSLYNSAISGVLNRAKPGSVAQAMIEAAGLGATVGEMVTAALGDQKPTPSITPIEKLRLTETLEDLRCVVLQAREAGRDGSVFVATLDTRADIMARLDFAVSFFATGGFDTIKSDTASAPAATRAAIDSGARVIAMCGRDQTYPDAIPSMAQELKSHDPTCLLVLIGQPRDESLRHAFVETGVDIMIHRHADRLTTLTRVAQHLGVIS